MANIVRTPNQGQPIDATYLKELADAINKLAGQVSSAVTASLLTVDTVSAGKQSIQTSDARIIAGYTEVTSSSSQSNNTVDWSYTFPPNFKYPPIVLATPINVTGSANSGGSVSVLIKSVGQTLINGSVTFTNSGNLTIGLNLLLIGIPNN